MSRDMTKEQFDKRVAELGFVREGFMGYYKLPEPFQNSAVSIFNAGPKRRDQLAYLIRQHETAEQKGQK